MVTTYNRGGEISTLDVSIGNIMRCQPIELQGSWWVVVNPPILLHGRYHLEICFHCCYLIRKRNTAILIAVEAQERDCMLNTHRQFLSRNNHWPSLRLDSHGTPQHYHVYGPFGWVENGSSPLFGVMEMRKDGKGLVWWKWGRMEKGVGGIFHPSRNKTILPNWGRKDGEKMFCTENLLFYPL